MTVLMTQTPTAPVVPWTPEESSDPPSAFRFTVEDYLKLGEVGILSPESRVELIDGLIVCKPMQHQFHQRAVRRLHNFMARFNGPDWTIQSQLPVNFEQSSLEPDVAILRGPEADYDHHQTTGSDVALVIEVADTSLAYDSGSKRRQFARAGIPVYWIVNIPDSRIEVLLQPEGNDYLTRTDFVVGQSVPVVLDGVTVTEFAVADIFA